MSYDLYLRDRVTGECLEVPGHLMYGGNIRGAFRDDGSFLPEPTTEAYLNITYNYSRYYHDAFPSAEEDEEQHAKDAKKFVVTCGDGGIRSLNGLTGAQAVPLLKEMIRRIERKNKDIEGWVSTEREKVWYERKGNPEAAKDPNEMLMEFLHLKRDGLSDGQAGEYLDKRWQKKSRTVYVCEGDTKDYWQPTAANAIRPLYQLIALSQLRPDGVWSEES